VASNICQLDDVASTIWQLAGVAPYEVASWFKARVDDVAGNIWQWDDAAGAGNVCRARRNSRG
jgi:hypothetical protein